MEGRNYSVLVADDDLLFAKELAKHITGEGYVVYEAHNGEEALEVALIENPSIYLIDLLLPVVDGYQTIKKIVEDDRLPESKVIAMSNVTEQDEISRALNLGALEYIRKADSTPGSIMEAIRRHLNCSECSS